MTYNVIQSTEVDIASSDTVDRRIREDGQRDPVDAERDAEILYETLCEIRDLLECPSMSYVLSARLREDLACGDRVKAAEKALMLLKASRKRSKEVLTKALQQCQHQAGALHKLKKGLKVDAS